MCTPVYWFSLSPLGDYTCCFAQMLKDSLSPLEMVRDAVL